MAQALRLTPPLLEDDAESELVRLALDLETGSCAAALSDEEAALVGRARAMRPSPPRLVELTREAILRGEDPLGERLCRLRTIEERRSLGAFYTPYPLVAPMVDWLLGHHPARVVDPGCGSGRFAAAVARLDRRRPILAVDIDPVATVLARAALAVLSAEAAVVLHGDYTTLALPQVAGCSGFVGNPPYVRHHELTAGAKRWAAEAGRLLGHRVSGLSGLHTHFFLATIFHGHQGDIGCYVTSAEWLDVGYGSALRELFLDGLGGTALHLIDPAAATFDEVQSTAVVTCFQLGAQPAVIQVRTAASRADLGGLEGGRDLARGELLVGRRWSKLVRPPRLGPTQEGTVPLGSLARVHRGLVTGANDFFVLSRERAQELGLLPWCRPAITDAQEILRAGGVLDDGPRRKLLLAVPRDIDRRAFPALEAYLRWGETRHGIIPPMSARYSTSHRRPWWYFGKLPTPPIVGSYMARQAPAFALNPDGLALLNIGHGIYPLEDLDRQQLTRLCQHLNAIRDSFRGEGRTYQGGLEKFEPREMEALRVAPLAAGAPS